MAGAFDFRLGVKKVLNMNTVTPLRPQGNHPSPIYRYFNDPLARTEARRAGLLDAEYFDQMCLAAARYRANPTPVNAVEAHIAARRYQGGQR